MLTVCRLFKKSSTSGNTFCMKIVNRALRYVIRVDSIRKDVNPVFESEYSDKQFNVGIKVELSIN